MSKPNLDQLLDLAGHQAQIVLVKHKMPELVPSWVLIQADGGTQIIGTPWRNDAEKTQTGWHMKAKMRELGTVAYSFVAEAWAATLPKAYQDSVYLPDELRPRNRPDRTEVVAALAANAQEAKYRQWEIKRDSDGHVIALERMEESLKGSRSWMAELLKP
jgi:hypothetical protein